MKEIDIDDRKYHLACKQIVDILSENNFSFAEGIYVLCTVMLNGAIQSGISKPNLLSYISFHYEKIDDALEKHFHSENL